MSRPMEIPNRREVDPVAEDIERQTQNRLREIDRFHTQRLCERYRHVVPPERIRAVKDLPTAFEDRQDFNRSYEQAAGEAPPEGKRVTGFSQHTLESAHVATDHPQMRKTIVHERLHQLSHPEAEERLGKKFCEGVTEDLAIDEMGGEGNPDLPPSYSEERALAHKTRQLCGDRAVERAYFKGDVRELRTCLDKRLGDRSAERLQKRVQESPELERRTDQDNG